MPLANYNVNEFIPLKSGLYYIENTIIIAIGTIIVIGIGNIMMSIIGKSSLVLNLLFFIGEIFFAGYIKSPKYVFIFTFMYWSFVVDIFSDQLKDKYKTIISECIVCNEINTIWILPCHKTHTICDGCLTKWIDNNPTCPMCRSSIQ